MQREIKHTFFFPYPPELVWDYLTKPELLSQWLMENNIQPIVGHKFQFRSKPNLDIDFDGIVYCEILEMVSLRRLSYSWKCNPINETFKIDTVVQWTLVPKNNGTELNLLQSGFRDKEYDNFYWAMEKGWTKRAEILLQSLNSNVK